jgi:hypothetical protein
VVVRHASSFFGGYTAMDPLPELRSTDLGSRRVLHEVVDGGCTHSAQPALEVANGDRDVGGNAGVGHRTVDSQVEQLACRDVHVIA